MIPGTAAAAHSLFVPLAVRRDCEFATRRFEPGPRRTSDQKGPLGFRFNPCGEFTERLIRKAKIRFSYAFGAIYGRRNRLNAIFELPTAWFRDTISKRISL